MQARAAQSSETSESAMKVAIMGAGAVGSYYGALLARAGHDVVLIGRPAFTEAVRRSGLWLESAAFTGKVDLCADTDASALRDAELVLFCVKSGDTVQAGRDIAPYVGQSASIISLQNGVDNAQRLAAVLARDVIPAVVYVAVDMAGPAHVRHHGRGELVIGASVGSAALAEALSAAGIPCEVSDRVLDALWSKLIINCAYNALSAISQFPYGRLVQSSGVPEVMRDVFDECVAVAEASAIGLPADLWQSTLAIAQSMSGQRSSTAQDLARGRPSEIDHLNGLIVRRGQQLGIATPVNRSLHTIVRLLEQGAIESDRAVDSA